MGRTKLFILILFSSFVGHSQCDKNYLIVKDSANCKTVEMSKERFTQYYIANKNLNLIKDSLPNLINSIDSLNFKADSLIEANNEIEISIASRDSLVDLSIEEYKNELVSIEIENTYLKSKITRHKKKRKKWFSAGAGSVLIITLLINLL